MAGTRQVDAALKSVATASTTTAQATQKLDQAAKTAGQALTAESQAAQAVTNALRQEAQASGTAASQTSEMSRAAQTAAAALQKEQQAALAAAEALHKTGQAAGTATSLVQRLGSSMGAIGQQAASFAVAQVGVQSLEQALSSVVGFATSSVRAAVQTESLAAAFKAIEGSGQAAGRTMQFLKDTANRLGVDVVALSGGFKTIDAAARGTTLQGEGIRKVFVAMAEASRVLGLSGQDLQGVLLAVGQSISKGTVQAEELRGQIGERLPGAFQLAARAMGVTTAELDKMMERGELQATTFWPRFAEVIKREFGGSVEEAAKTAGAAFERFHNTMREFQVNVGQLIIPGLNWIIDKMNAVAGAANKAAQAIKDVGKAERDAAAESQRLAGGKDVATDLQRQRTAAVAEEAAARAARIGTGAMMGQGSPQYAAAQERENAAIARRIDLDRQLATASKAAQRAGDPLGEGAMVEPGARDERLVEFQTKLADQVKANRTELENLDRVTQQLYGRKPSEEEILKVKEKQVDATRKLIDTSQELWNRSKDTAPAKELRAQAAGAEALEKSIKAAGEATREKEKKDSEAEQARKKKEQEDEAYATKSIARFKDIGAEEDRHFEQLKRLEAQYTAVKATRDDDTASMLAASLQTSQYADEATRLAARIEDVMKAEAKLPQLRSEAATSATELENINRIMGQLGPSRRTMSREEQLAAKRAELAAVTDDAGTLARADERIRTTLDTEQWDAWRDAGLDAMSDLSSALTDFVFTGKGSLTDLANHAVQQFFRMASEQTFRAMFNSDTAQGLFKAGLSLFGVVAGAGGGTGAFVGGDAPGMQHGGPVSAGRPYIVGEAGPELFVPKMPGTVIPHGQAMGGPTVINVNVHGVTDATSFIQSQGAVKRAVAHTVSASYRGL